MAKGWSDGTLPPEECTTVEEQQAALREAKRNVPRGAENYGFRVLAAWFNNLDYTLMDVGRGTCMDCYEDKQLFAWNGWPDICGWCSYNRLTNGGENPNRIEEPWNRPDEWYPSGRAPDTTGTRQDSEHERTAKQHSVEPVIRTDIGTGAGTGDD